MSDVTDRDVEALSGGLCPDGAKCHHACPITECFRVRTCEPLSGVYADDRWPLVIRRAYGGNPYDDAAPDVPLADVLMEVERHLVAVLDEMRAALGGLLPYVRHRYLDRADGTYGECSAEYGPDGDCECGAGAAIKSARASMGKWK